MEWFRKLHLSGQASPLIWFTKVLADITCSFLWSITVAGFPLYIASQPRMLWSIYVIVYTLSQIGGWILRWTVCLFGSYRPILEKKCSGCAWKWNTYPVSRIFGYNIRYRSRDAYLLMWLYFLMFNDWDIYSMSHYSIFINVFFLF